jgi:hypothetical protein
MRRSVPACRTKIGPAAATKLWRKLGGLVVFAILLNLLSFISSESARSQESLAETTHRIVEAKLLAPGVGWVSLMRNFDCGPGGVGPSCPPMRLYWTDDDGRYWSNITPREMSTRNIGQVFFLDSSHGWMMSSDALGDQANAPFFLFSSQNGGKTWRSLVLRRPMFNLMDDYTFPVDLCFSDSRHGWMLWRWAMMNSRKNYLLATTDGGRTWRRLADPPIGDSLQFVSPRDGWMLGTSQKDIGIPIPENDALWATRDAGNHWKEISIPLPRSLRNRDLYFDAVKFEDFRDGVLLGGKLETDGQDQQSSFVWITRDGGETWTFSKAPGSAAHVSLTGRHTILSFRDTTSHEIKIQKGGRTLTLDLPLDLPPLSTFGFPDFINDADAWMNAQGSLLSSTNGGKSFRAILPSSNEPDWPPPPEIVAVNGISLPLPGVADSTLPFVNEGKPAEIRGTGFLGDNSVVFGPTRLHAPSDSGENLSFTVPDKLPLGNYSMLVENTHGKSLTVSVLLCSQTSPQIFEVRTGFVTVSEQTAAHPGQRITVSGCGFEKESVVWFGPQAIAASTTEVDGRTLFFDVPASLPEGTYEVYVANAGGKSNTSSIVIE